MEKSVKTVISLLIVLTTCIATSSVNSTRSMEQKTTFLSGVTETDTSASQPPHLPTASALIAPNSNSNFQRALSQRRSAPDGNDLGETKFVAGNELTDDLETWEAPLFIRTSYPYYLAGYDDDSRPIWICELGKFNIRKVVEGHPDGMAYLDKYIRQSAYRIIKSIYNVSTHEFPVTEAMYIVDLDGIDLSQLSHIPTVNYVLRMARLYSKLIIDHLGGTIVINANYLAISAVNLLRPVFGGAMEKVDIYGTRKEKWLPILRARFPRATLPEWYGGYRNFKPIAIYG